MLKKTCAASVLLAGCMAVSGCSVFSLQRIRNKVNSVADDLFSQSTITMPVLVTSTPTYTASPFPTATITPLPSATPTATDVVPIEYASPTFEVLSTAEMPISAKDSIGNITDVTIPDDTVLEPGQLFIKSWRMTNTGQSTWTENETKLMMEPNYDMGMPEAVKAIFLRPNDWIDFTPGGWGTRMYNVGPGTEVDLAVILKAPPEPGSYQIHFRLVNPDGEIIPTQFWMRFAVSRPTETPTPSPTPETPQPEPLRYDWNGRWMVREPFRTDGAAAPANAWLSQNGEELTGFIYDSAGNPVIVKGALSGNGRFFNGEIYYPWQKETKAVSWRMLGSGEQFYAVTPLGVADENTVCGARGGYNLPADCALPAEG